MNWIQPVAITLIAALAILAMLYIIARRAGADPEDAAYHLAEILVRAAEQRFPHLSGEARYEYVIDALQERFPGIDAAFLQSLIESAVYDLNREQAAGRIWEMGPPDAEHRGPDDWE